MSRRWLVLALLACGEREPSWPADAGGAIDATPRPDGPVVAACEAFVAAEDVPRPLADQATTESRLVVPDVGTGRITVGVELRHPYPRDLTLNLVSPRGTAVVLSRRHGEGGGYLGTAFADDAAQAIADGAGAFGGVFRPDEPLAALADEPFAGEWTLRIEDAAAGDAGTLDGWWLRVNACAAPSCVTSILRVPADSASSSSGRLLVPFPARLDPTTTVVGVRALVNVKYAYDQDLVLALWSPDGTRVALSTHRGGVGSHFLGTVFDDAAALSIGDGRAPFRGSFRPEEPLARLAGEPAAGLWFLTVTGPITTASIAAPAAGEALALELDLCEMTCPDGSEARSYPGSGAILVDEPGLVRAVGLRLTLPRGRPGVELSSPAGDTVLVVDGEVSSAFFFDGAARRLEETPEPHVGAFRPAEPLAPLAGGPAAGVWTVTSAGEAVLELCVEN